jgi:hypothetical protein
MDPPDRKGHTQNSARMEPDDPCSVCRKPDVVGSLHAILHRSSFGGEGRRASTGLPERACRPRFTWRRQVRSQSGNGGRRRTAPPSAPS